MKQQLGGNLLEDLARQNERLTIELRAAERRNQEQATALGAALYALAEVRSELSSARLREELLQSILRER